MGRMSQAREKESEVLVIGGGPAGATTAAFLARRGRSVVMLERDCHPRFHIGESLLPANVPILERLGILEQVRQIGVLKRGADFPAANAAGFNAFRFDRALGSTPGYAFQVRRDEFDQLLFSHAASLGVEAHDGARVTRVDVSTDGVVAMVETRGGETWTVRARYLVDATGRDTLLGKQLGIRRKHPRHQSAALFAHFRGVTGRSGEDAGNISIYVHEHGWAWMIPLRGGLMSVGIVAQPALFRMRRESPAEFLRNVLDRVPQARERMSAAEMVGNLHATGNYSYLCDRIAGPGWIMVGDAGAFVDPIFSTGVYLAMRSAERAAAAIDGILLQPGRERALQREYVRETRAGLKALSWFIVRFTTPAMRWLFANPRNDFQLEQAVISMLAGDVFAATQVKRRLAVFKLLYYVVALGRLGDTLADRRRRKQRLAEVFTGGTTSQDPG
jgi:flavin-dependent dehydrogenase